MIEGAAGFDVVELYSCFPYVPKMARRTLGLGPEVVPTVVGGLKQGGEKSRVRAVGGTSRPERGPVAGTMDRARPQQAKRRREDDRALLDWPTRSSSDTIRWRPSADPGQKRDTGDRISARRG